MATIIDSLLVSLGLDDADFQKKRRGVDEGLDQTRTRGQKMGTDIDDAVGKMGLGFSKLRGEVVGLFLAFAGAKTATSFLTNMVTQVREMGTAAQIMGVSVNTLNAWGNAAKDAGGQAADAIQAFSVVNSYFADFTRNPGNIGAHAVLFSQLGLSGGEKDFADPEKLFGRLADQYQKEVGVARASGDPLAEHRVQATFEQRLHEFGITSTSMIRMIESSREAMEREIKANKERNTVTEKDVQAAQDMTAALNHLAMSMYGVAQKMGIIQGLDGLAQVLDTLTGSTDKLGEAGHTLAAGFLAMFDPIQHLVRLLRGMGLISASTADSIIKADPMARAIADNVLAPSPHDVHGGIGGAVGGAVTSGGGNRNVGSVLKYFMLHGVPMETAVGLTAAVAAEGGLKQRTGGGYQGRAIGIGQLLGTRRSEFLKKYGSNFTFENEMEFMLHELQGGDKGGRSVLAAGNRDAALVAAVTKFFRPAQGRETVGDIGRGRGWLQRFGAAQGARTSIHVTVHANGHSDPHKIAKHTAQAVKHAVAGYHRVANSNTGVQ